MFVTTEANRRTSLWLQTVTLPRPWLDKHLERNSYLLAGVVIPNSWSANMTTSRAVVSWTKKHRISMLAKPRNLTWGANKQMTIWNGWMQSVGWSLNSNLQSVLIGWKSEAPPISSYHWLSCITIQSGFRFSSPKQSLLKTQKFYGLTSKTEKCKAGKEEQATIICHELEKPWPWRPSGIWTTGHPGRS